MTNDLPPVVLVGGFLTRNTQSYWGDVEQFYNDGRKVIIAPVGACSSVHDRACEIFYSLKGGRIDYGAEHAQAHKHGRYGRKYPKGLYPEWSNNKPVHFVTHSLGGPTVMKLIALLRSKFFGENYGPDMARSIFAVAAPFKGTPTIYLLGASYTSDQYTLRPLSIGNFIAKYIHISSFLSPLLPHNPEAWDFQPDSRNLGIFALPHNDTNDDEEMSAPRRTWSALKRSISTLWSQLRTSDWADSSDSGSYDSGFHAAEAREKAGENELNPNTFYCSLTGTITSKHSDSNHHRPSRRFRSDIGMYILAKMVGSFSYKLSPAPECLFQKPTSTPTNTLSPPELNLKRSKRPMKRRTLTASSFPPIEEEDDLSPDMACLRSMGLHSRVASSESTTSEAESRPSSSMSGSSGWRSSTRSSYESLRPSLSPTDEMPESSSSLSSSSSGSSLASPGLRGHNRRWSSTDWYADWAEQWTEMNTDNAETVPSAYDDAISGSQEEKKDGRQFRHDLWENDGVVPVFSQEHPSECSISHCQHHGDFELTDSPSPTSCNSLHIGSFEKGVWHVLKSEGMPHDSFVGGLARYESQRTTVWKKISEAMADLDDSSSTNEIYDNESSTENSFQFKQTTSYDTTTSTTFTVTPPSPMVERCSH